MTPDSSIFPYTDKCLVTDVKNKFMVESEIAQSCPTLCDPMACSLPGSSIHGIFQARILEWVVISKLSHFEQSAIHLYSYHFSSLMD